MAKKIIRLTESDLHKIVKESVNKIIKEIIDAEPYEYDGYNPSDEEKKYYDVLKQYAKMPDGYDEDLDKGLDYDSIDNNNDEHWTITGALDKLASLNKNDEAEMFQYI